AAAMRYTPSGRASPGSNRPLVRYRLSSVAKTTACQVVGNRNRRHSADLAQQLASSFLLLVTAALGHLQQNLLGAGVVPHFDIGLGKLQLGVALIDIAEKIELFIQVEISRRFRRRL